MNWRRLLPRFGPKIEGFVDRVIASEIVGWAYDPSRPDGRVLVVARRGGEVVAETLADLPRRDLAEKGDGRHGFRLRVPPSLEDGVSHQLSIEAQIGRRRTRLQQGAVTFLAEGKARPAGRGAAKLKADSKQLTAGFLERASDGVLRGWAVNPYDPEPPALLDVYDDEVFLGVTTADISRPKLQQTGAPAGARGFEFELPADIDAGAIDRLRVRVAGTYLDLKRSKIYPGDGTSAPVDGPSGLDGPRVQASAPKAARTVALLVCGGGEGLLLTLQSWTAQEGAETLCALAEAPGQDTGVAIPGNLAMRRFDPGEDTALRRYLAGADSVVLAKPGEALDPELAAVLLRTARAADVVIWDVGGLAPRPAEAELAVLLGERLDGGFAVRGPLLEAYEGDLAKELSAGRLRSLELWLAADPSLRWEALRAPFSTRAAAPSAVEEESAPASGFRRARTGGEGPPVTPARSPALLSLAVWTGWGKAPPPALGSLLAGAKGLNVEVLTPLAPEGGAMEMKIRDLAGKGLAGLHFKQVEPPAGGAPGALWRRLGEAASGDAVVLCHGDVQLVDPASLAEILAWSLEPRTGAVCVEIAAEGSDEVLAGLSVQLGSSGPSAGSAFDPRLAGRARPVAAAPAAFMAVARSALALAGGFDATSFPVAFADLDLGLRLRLAGRRSVLLGHLRAKAPKDMPGFEAAAPLSPGAATLLSRRLEGSTARKAAA